MTAMSLCFMFSAVSLVLLHSSSASRVIFMPFPITSQAYIHVQMARAMMDRGHQVWLVVSDIVVDKNVLTYTTGISVIQFHTGYSIEPYIFKCVTLCTDNKRAVLTPPEENHMREFQH
ncbi:hypothetical protein V1264_005451 [Littorina saxatilis]|uniref:Uncharacterized protein n=1 Tax=Littorina saxatilis TaxID=31220 RepID=A0AAN9B215_9CAEN